MIWGEENTMIYNELHKGNWRGDWTRIEVSTCLIRIVTMKQNRLEDVYQDSARGPTEGLSGAIYVM